MTSPVGGSPEADGTRCTICGVVETDATLITGCYDCGAPFHLNPYSNQPGIDCGDAVLGENMGLYLFCQRCLEERDREATERFGGDDPAARAEAMITAIHGSALGIPSRAEPTPPPARRRSGTRRRYRRIDVDHS